MLFHKLKLVALTVLFFGAVATGAVSFSLQALAHSREGEAPAEPPSPSARREARPPNEARPPDSPARMTVVGRVLDPSGRPVPGASVMVYARARLAGLASDGPPEKSAASIGHASADGSGHFQLDATRTTSARYVNLVATALAPGYGVGWAGLDPDADRPIADIALRPEQVIRGRFFDVQGRPVRELKVSVRVIRRGPAALGPGAPSDGPTSAGGGWSEGLPGWPRPAITDAEGRFTLRGAGRGLMVSLGIDDPRFAPQRILIQTDDSPESKPLTLAVEPARIITGRVTYADTGRPVPRDWIEVGAFEGGVITPAHFQADAEGRFRANPDRGSRYDVIAYPPDGQPYLAAQRRLEWPKGSIEQATDLALPRGVLIRGKVVEEGDGRPVAGAAVKYEIAARPREDRTDWSRVVMASVDGSFAIAVPPRPGHLIVRGPDDYVLRELDSRLLYAGSTAGRRYYVHGLIACDPKPGGDGLDIDVRLRRGVTVRGRLIGPDGRPAPEAWIISRVILPPLTFVERLWWGRTHAVARDGRFELHGLDPGADVPVHFLEPKGKLGATAMLPGRSGADDALTVRLEPCGAARARLVAADGKPIPGLRNPQLIAMVVTPGPPLAASDPTGQPAADEENLPRIDAINYGNPPTSDAEGHIVFPALIPGATYRVRTFTRDRRTGSHRDFTVKPGETLDLGDIPIHKPPA